MGSNLIKPIKVTVLSGRSGDGLPPMTADQTWRAVFIETNEDQDGKTLIELFRENFH